MRINSYTLNHNENKCIVSLLLIQWIRSILYCARNSGEAIGVKSSKQNCFLHIITDCRNSRGEKMKRKHFCGHFLDFCVATPIESHATAYAYRLRDAKMQNKPPFKIHAVVMPVSQCPLSYFNLLGEWWCACHRNATASSSLFFAMQLSCCAYRKNVPRHKIYSSYALQCKMRHVPLYFRVCGVHAFFVFISHWIAFLANNLPPLPMMAYAC